MDAVLKEQEQYEGDYVARFVGDTLVLEEVDDFVVSLELDDIL